MQQCGKLFFRINNTLAEIAILFTIRIRILDRLKKQPGYDSSHHEINKLIKFCASVVIKILFKLTEYEYFGW